MLVLTRKVGEQIFLNNSQIQIKVLFIRKGNVGIGIKTPPGMEILREEIFFRKKEDEQVNVKEGIHLKLKS